MAHCFLRQNLTVSQCNLVCNLQYSPGKVQTCNDLPVLFLIVCTYVYVCMGAESTHAMVYIWKSENSFVEFVLSFHLHVDLGALTKVSRLGGKHLSSDHMCTMACA